jgi:hypothetical protein
MGMAADGTPICVGSGDENNPPPPKTTTQAPPVTNPDGSTSQTTTTTTGNKDGSTTTTTTTTTTGAGGGPVTTETTSTTGNTPNGLPGKSDSRPEEQANLCKQMPHLTICNNSSVAGSCGAVSCMGDAIQCATLREIAKRNCDQKAGEDAVQASSQYSLGTAIFNGADPASGTFPTSSNGVTVDFGTLNQNAFLGGGADCLADKPFQVAGQSFVIPFSSVCDHLLPFRYMMLIIAALASLRLVSKGIFQ